MDVQDVTTGNGGTPESKPFFSIVMPYKDAYDSIGQAIETIRGQTYKNWELIIVNDGSDENMLLPILAHFKDERIRYYYKEWSGIAQTRNFGNQKAKGDWIVVCDADDIWLSNRLKLTKRYIEKYPDRDFIYGGIFWGSASGLAVREYWKPMPLTAEKLREGKQVIIHGSCAYRRKVALETPYRREQKVNDDFWFIIDCWNKRYKFGIIQRPLMIYRVLPDGVSKTHYLEIQKEIKEKLKTQHIRND